MSCVDSIESSSLHALTHHSPLTIHPIIVGFEMFLDWEFFKSDKDVKAATVVLIAFPLITGSGTLTTIMSLKAN